MHVVHVIRDLDTASGGPSRSLPALARSLGRNHPDLHVTTLFQDRGYEMTVDLSNDTAADFQAVRGGSLLGPRWVRNRLAQMHGKTPIDLVHLHGLWSPSIHLSARFARQRRIPHLITPRGMLSTWCLGNKSLRKRIAWRTYQRDDLLRADCLHATSPSEVSDIQSSGIPGPIAMIPHGCELPPHQFAASGSNSRLAVCITRLHPVKGLAELLDAWADVRPVGWQLTIAGPDHQGYGDELRAQIQRLDLHGSVEITGSVDGEKKWQLLSQAELFLSASHSENFGMSIAESLAAGTPVITTRGTPWQSIIDHHCGWWVPVGSESLAKALREATSLSSADLSKMGVRGSDLVRSQFCWDAIALRMIALYHWLVDRSSAPPADIHVART